MAIAWSHLEDIEQAQLKACCPQVRRIFNCTRPECGGQVLDSYGERKCLLCSAEYDEKGELINGS